VVFTFRCIPDGTRSGGREHYLTVAAGPAHVQVAERGYLLEPDHVLPVQLKQGQERGDDLVVPGCPRRELAERRPAKAAQRAGDQHRLAPDGQERRVNVVGGYRRRLLRGQRPGGERRELLRAEGKQYLGQQLREARLQRDPARESAGGGGHLAGEVRGD